MDVHQGSKQNLAPAKIQFPPGYRFVPTDAELIVEYLLKKINNHPIPIAEISDTYLRLANPNHLTEKFPKLGDNEWYFFTPRDRKYPNGKRPDRGSVSGYWKATGADKKVEFEGEVVGYRKALVFYEGKPQQGQKTNWIMHEFRVDGFEHRKRTAEDMRLDDWVLCRIYEKASRFTNMRQPNRKAKKIRDVAADEETPTRQDVQVMSSSVGDQVGSNYENVPVTKNPVINNCVFEGYGYHEDQIPFQAFDSLSTEGPAFGNGHLQSYDSYNYGIEKVDALGNICMYLNEEAGNGEYWSNEAFVSCPPSYNGGYDSSCKRFRF